MSVGSDKWSIFWNYVDEIVLLSKLGLVVKSLMPPTEESEIPGSIPGPAYTFIEIDHDFFSTVVYPLPMIQEGLFTVTGESMGTKYWLTT